jgi:hypothetical protein
VGVDIGVESHAGIEKHGAPRMLNEIAQNRGDLWRARAGLLARPDEIAEVDAPYLYVCHT